MARPDQELRERGGIAVPAEAILGINKPIGWSSFDVVRMVKKRHPHDKVGHAGTLDPFAEGLLLVCIGRATKEIAALMAYEKEYHARMRLGIATDTLDIAGRITRQCKVQLPGADEIAEIMQSFVGVIEQTPPRFSALRHEGRRFYEMARAGQEEQPQARSVYIHSITLQCITGSAIDFSTVCSKGTYIRTLAQDIAARLGTVAFLSHLRRTRIGPFDIADAIAVTTLREFSIAQPHHAVNDSCKLSGTSTH